MIKFEDLILDVKKLIISKLNRYDMIVLTMVSKFFNKFPNYHRYFISFMVYLVKQGYFNLVKYFHNLKKMDHILTIYNNNLLPNLNYPPSKLIANMSIYRKYIDIPDITRAAICSNNIELLKWIHENKYACGTFIYRKNCSAEMIDYISKINCDCYKWIVNCGHYEPVNYNS